MKPDIEKIREERRANRDDYFAGEYVGIVSMLGREYDMLKYIDELEAKNGKQAEFIDAYSVYINSDPSALNLTHADDELRSAWQALQEAQDDE